MNQIRRISFSPPDVEVNRSKHDNTFDNILKRKMDAGLIQSFIQNADDNCPEQRAAHRPNAAGETGATNNHGGNCV
jgi:hypothetical protein